MQAEPRGCQISAAVPASSLQTSWVELVVLTSPPGSEGLARFFSALGGEWFYLLLIPLLLWRGSWSQAVKAARVMIFADLIGEFIKWTLRWPRPPADLALATETSPGFVSTHAALSLGIAWILLGENGKRRAPWLALWVLGVAWSRVRLGVHFPFDILGGWVVGFGVAAAVRKWGEDSFRVSSLSIAACLFLALFWPEGGFESLQRDLGLLYGLELGLIIRLARGLPEPKPLPWAEVLLRLAGLAVLYFGLKTLDFARFPRYFALGLWTSFRRGQKKS